MSREAPHVKFPAQVLMDLSANRPFRTQTKEGHLHVCFDTKLKQNAFNNFLLSHTPYRYSLLEKPKAMEAKRRREKRANKVRITTDENMSSTRVSLPKIPLASDSLIRRNGFPESSTIKQEVQEAKKDIIELESEEENAPCDFLSCGSVKIEEQSRKAVSPQPTIRATRSMSLPLILNRRNSCCLRKDTAHTCESVNELQSTETDYTAKKIDSVIGCLKKRTANDDEFTTVMEDGAKVTINQRRLSIEVFMPRTS